MEWHEGIFSTGGVIYYVLAGQIQRLKRLWFLSNRNSRNQFSPLLLFQKRRTRPMLKYTVIGLTRDSPALTLLGWTGTETQTPSPWDGGKEEIRLSSRVIALWSFSCGPSLGGNELLWKYPMKNSDGILMIIWPSYTSIGQEVTSLWYHIFSSMNMVHLPFIPFLLYIFRYKIVFLYKDIAHYMLDLFRDKL